jgi:acyl carrier protein
MGIHAETLIHEELTTILTDRGQPAPSQRIEGSLLELIDSLTFVDLLLRLEERTGVTLDVSTMDLAELVQVNHLVGLIESSKPGSADTKSK